MGQEVGAPYSYCSEVGEDSGRGRRRVGEDERVVGSRTVIELAVKPEVNDRAQGDAGRRRRVALCEGDLAVHQARRRCGWGGRERPMGYDVTLEVRDMRTRSGARGRYHEDGCGHDDRAGDGRPAVAAARRGHRPLWLLGTVAPGVAERAPAPITP